MLRSKANNNNNMQDQSANFLAAKEHNCGSMMIHDGPIRTKGHSSLKSSVLKELKQLSRVAVGLFKGQGSLISYLLIPTIIGLLWVLLCIITIQRPSLPLEDRLSQKHIRDLFEAQVFEEGLLKVVEEAHEPVVLEDGEVINVVVAMPFLDMNPLGATEYISLLEWILIYSSLPVTFQVITNTDSIPYVEKIFDKLKKEDHGAFDKNITTLADIMEKCSAEICPKLMMKSEFCDVVMGSMTPLLFPYLFPEMDEVIYLDRALTFQEDIAQLYKIVRKLKESKAAIAMAPEQTNAYMRSFSNWQRLNPMTKVGRPPPEGNPGFNPSLMLMDLSKLRSNNGYKIFFNEKRLNKLVKNYMYVVSGDNPSLGDMVNLMAVDQKNLFYPLGCEWNRRAEGSHDHMEKKFNICNYDQPIKVWNGSPSNERLIQHQQDKKHSIGKKLIEK